MAVGGRIAGRRRAKEKKKITRRKKKILDSHALNPEVPAFGVDDRGTRSGRSGRTIPPRDGSPCARVRRRTHFRPAPVLFPPTLSSLPYPPRSCTRTVGRAASLFYYVSTRKTRCYGRPRDPCPGYGSPLFRLRSPSPPAFSRQRARSFDRTFSRCRPCRNSKFVVYRYAYLQHSRLFISFFSFFYNKRFRCLEFDRNTRPS